MVQGSTELRRSGRRVELNVAGSDLLRVPSAAAVVRPLPGSALDGESEGDSFNNGANGIEAKKLHLIKEDLNQVAVARHRR
jgi:hypothetical protein